MSRRCRAGGGQQPISRRAALLGASVLLFGFCSGVHGQSAATSDPTDFTLEVTTREVLVDVVATDRGRFVPHLQPSDFQVFELNERGEKVPQTVSAVYVVQAGMEQSDSGSATLHAVLGGTCAENNLQHYQVAYRVSADRKVPGAHTILVTTSRRGTRLVFGHSYFVGSPEPSAAAERLSAAEESRALFEAACFHPRTPLTLALRAHHRLSGEANGQAKDDANADPKAQYVLVLQPRSFDLISLSQSTPRTHLEYGVCTFAANGSYLAFTQGSADVELGAGDNAKLRHSGLSSFMTLPTKGDPVFARFVLRDPRTGNMGSADLAVAPTRTEGSQPPDVENSFGTIVPRSGSMCGDVYELPRETPALPDFFKLEPVGSLHTFVFDLPRQVWTKGLVGATREVDFFGIDYYGTFWVSVPGEYTFELGSDDGSMLFLDDKMILDDDRIHPMRVVRGQVKLDRGRHTLHLPYYQGRPNSIGLQLFVKPPHGEMELFDIRNFAPPVPAGETR